jgi:hypothetical protein
MLFWLNSWGANPAEKSPKADIIAPLECTRQSPRKRSAGHVDIHRGDIDAVIDHMLKGTESEVRLQAFVFDRQAVGKLVLSLWKFVRQHCGLITRSDGAGDIWVTVDFSHVIPPAHLDAQVELLKLNQAGSV